MKYFITTFLCCVFSIFCQAKKSVPEKAKYDNKTKALTAFAKSFINRNEEQNIKQQKNILTALKLTPDNKSLLKLFLNNAVENKIVAESAVLLAKLSKKYPDDILLNLSAAILLLNCEKNEDASKLAIATITANQYKNLNFKQQRELATLVELTIDYFLKEKNFDSGNNFFYHLMINANFPKNITVHSAALKFFNKAKKLQNFNELQCQTNFNYCFDKTVKLAISQKNPPHALKYIISLLEKKHENNLIETILLNSLLYLPENDEANSMLASFYSSTKNWQAAIDILDKLNKISETFNINNYKY